MTNIFFQNPEKNFQPVVDWLFFFSFHCHTIFIKCEKKRKKLFVLLKIPQGLLEAMSSPEETMADCNMIYSTDNVASSSIPAALEFFKHGNEMNGAFQEVHH